MVRFMVLALSLMCVGCEPPANGQSSTSGKKPTTSGKKPTMNTSTVELVKDLPNLESMQIVSCAFKKTVIKLPSDLPSPSDTRLQIVGWVQLSEPRLEALKSQDTWTPITREKVPPELKQILPESSLLESAKVNTRFNRNPKMAHGLLIIPVDGKENKVYILAQDLDHPIGK